MNDRDYIISVSLFVLIISTVAAGIFMTTTDPEPIVFDTTAPPSLGVIGYIWDSLSHVIEYLNYQIVAVPLFLNFIIMFPMAIGLLFVLIKLIPTVGSGS